MESVTDPPDEAQSVGPSLLRAELARRGLSLTAAVEACGLDRFTLNRLLDTKDPPRRVTVDHAIALASAFGIPVEAWTAERLAAQTPAEAP